MIILKAIGNFFARIWRWIKETAWVQPLLIVGLIFSVIFSIPHINSWVENFSIEKANNYYTGFKLRLEGEKTTNMDKPVTEADKITQFIYDVSNLTDSNDHQKYASYEDYKAGVSALLERDFGTGKDFAAMTKKYGEKFILMYVAEDCTACNSARPGFEELQKRWNSTYKSDDGRPFKLHTIYTDDESSNDNKDPNGYTAFERYLTNYGTFFNLAYDRFENSRLPYRSNITDEQLLCFGDAGLSTDDHAFQTPTILLVDVSKEAFEMDYSRPGASELMFGVGSSGDYKAEKARVLLNMWNHTSADSRNPFSNSYSKN